MPSADANVACLIRLSNLQLHTNATVNEKLLQSVLAKINEHVMNQNKVLL